MIFITLGTQKLQFNRLLEMMDRLIKEGIIEDEVYAQVGYSTYIPENYSFTDFLKKTDYQKKIREADLIIAHGGVGTIMSCLSENKKLIVIPRTKKNNEHVDDHQHEIAEKYAENGYLLWAKNYDELKEAVLSIHAFSARKYEKRKSRIEKIIERFINNRQRRVLMVGSDLSVKGGIVSVLKNYLNYEDWETVDVSFLATHIEGSVWKKIFFFCKSLMKCRKLLNKQSIDIVHIHMSERGSFTRKAIILTMAKKRNCKVILHHHGAEFVDFYKKSGNKKKKKIRRILGEADLNLVLSRCLIPIYREIATEAQIECLYNTVKLPKENMYNLEAREFTMLGRLEKRKGIYDLLDTIKKTDAMLAPDIKFNLCGDGNIEAVKNRIKELQIEHRIGHLGWVEGNAKSEILKRTMAHVLVSYHEGLPMAILETMSWGIVNISTRVAAIPEVISDRENGFLLEPGNKEKLAQILVEISENQSLRKYISENSFEFIAKEFSIQSGVHKLEQIYKEM